MYYVYTLCIVANITYTIHLSFNGQYVYHAYRMQLSVSLVRTHMNDVLIHVMIKNSIKYQNNVKDKQISRSGEWLCTQLAAILYTMDTA